MQRQVYRYVFDEHIPFREVLATVDLAIIAVESLHGEERARLDARFAADEVTNTIAIDAATPTGQQLNQIFVGYARREFGGHMFKVTRCVLEEQNCPKEARCACAAL